MIRYCLAWSVVIGGPLVLRCVPDVGNDFFIGCDCIVRCLLCA